MKHEHILPELPYALDALEPNISRETLEYHYGKHHAAYINKLNDGIKDTKYADKSLEDIIATATGPIFNNAAQAWNHAFYWQCMTPKASKAGGDILDAIKRKFQSLERFEAEFAAAANSHFGSGWVWLVLDKNGELNIASTHDADTPLRHGETPLMVCDVWEHAYYIDHRNVRPDYVKAFMNVLNWDFVNQQFKQARQQQAA